MLCLQRSRLIWRQHRHSQAHYSETQPIALPVLRALRMRIDPREYNGASFVGLRGIVIKSHGGADVVAFTPEQL